MKKSKSITVKSKDAIDRPAVLRFLAQMAVAYPDHEYAIAEVRGFVVALNPVDELMEDES